MLLFVDESGTDRKKAPYEILAGVAIHESRFWNLVQAIRAAETELFGTPLHQLGIEFKGKTLLKRKIFRFASQGSEIPLLRRRELTRRFLEKGTKADDMLQSENFRREEFTAYGQSVLEFVHRIFDLCATHQVKIFASMVSKDAHQPSGDLLRKDYAYLFERYFHYLEDIAPDEYGLIIFDEIEKSRCRRLINQMEKYFVETSKGRIRSARIIPEPFFVHSDLTKAVQIADIVAYCLNWGVRLKRMTQPTRVEMEPFGQMAFNLKYVGKRFDDNGKEWPVYGVTYIDDLRPVTDRL
ncbi:DUF3800 domain-containing protein [candidate division KSB1 bacterium]|nr:DUF3800 domain-containing protein [candidate division KSB1 bacterium]